MTDFSTVGVGAISILELLVELLVEVLLIEFDDCFNSLGLVRGGTGVLGIMLGKGVAIIEVVGVGSIVSTSVFLGGIDCEIGARSRHDQG